LQSGEFSVGEPSVFERLGKNGEEADDNDLVPPCPRTAEKAERLFEGVPAEVLEKQEVDGCIWIIRGSTNDIM